MHARSVVTRFYVGVLAVAALMLVLPTGAQEPRAAAPATTADASAGKGIALQIDISGAIGPATADFIERALRLAVEREARLLLIRLDTPGGLDLSTRDIIKAILNSPVPVATYVAPEGARAASAGTYILYASHIAAMSPATNVGAATPVALIGGQSPGKKPAGNEPAERDEGETGQPADPADAMSRKVINDSIAYLRGLADRHGRNVEWAELAVREADSITAEKALEIGVIDLIARDVPDLLAQMDGRTVSMLHGAELVLQTENLGVEPLEPDWKTQLLGVITSPTIAYMLLLVGVYGLVLEGYNPGALLPGVVGAICLLLALYALQMLPVNYAGFGLIVLGVLLMIAEALAPSFGVLGMGGIIALVIGSIILIDTDAPGFVVSRPLIGAIALVSGLGLMAIIGFAVKARRRPVVTGREQLVGSSGTALEDFDGPGFVRAHGERWSAWSSRPVALGQEVVITDIDGLTLQVEPVATPMVRPETGRHSPA